SRRLQRPPISASSPRSRACASSRRASSARACAGTPSMPRSSTARPRSPPNKPPPMRRQHENEPFVVNREVRAVIVPAGQEVNLKPGQAGYITQALGGSFTVYLDGNLLRIPGEDADAIGKEPVKAPELPPNATEEDVRQLAWDQMRTCYDPEIPINIVELGL